jgi:hypothetical protein
MIHVVGQRRGHLPREHRGLDEYHGRKCANGVYTSMAHTTEVPLGSPKVQATVRLPDGSHLCPHCFHPRDARCTLANHGPPRGPARGHRRYQRGEANWPRTQITLVPRLISQAKKGSSASHTVTVHSVVSRISCHASPRRQPERTIVDSLTVAFGVAVARRRRAMGISWRELGTRCRVSANTVRNVERGSGSSRLNIIARVAEGLGTPLSRLIREAEKGRL